MVGTVGHCIVLVDLSGEREDLGKGFLITGKAAQVNRVLQHLEGCRGVAIELGMRPAVDYRSASDLRNLIEVGLEGAIVRDRLAVALHGHRFGGSGRGVLDDGVLIVSLTSKVHDAGRIARTLHLTQHDLVES